jgi:hypothetical protein
LNLQASIRGKVWQKFAGPGKYDHLPLNKLGRPMSGATSVISERDDW